MIPWPSSIRRYSTDFAQQNKELRLLRNETGKEIRYWRNFNGRILNLLQRQRRELEAQKELLENLPNELQVQPNIWSSASPMYIFTTDISDIDF